MDYNHQDIHFCFSIIKRFISKTDIIPIYSDVFQDFVSDVTQTVTKDISSLTKTTRQADVLNKINVDSQERLCAGPYSLREL